MAFTTNADDPIEKRTTSVGTVLPHFKAKLVDSNGLTVPTGVPGEVWTAGYALQKGHVPFDFAVMFRE